MSIPVVSDTRESAPYHWQMENDSWKGWGPRFKKLAKENGETLATIAEKMGLAESTLRHWTNGTREINLTDLMRMCKAARVHPSLVLGIIYLNPLTSKRESCIILVMESPIPNDRRSK